MAADSKSLFGRIAVAKGWIDQAAVDRCLSIQQAQQDDSPALGEIMVREGLLTGEQVVEILATQRRMRQASTITGYELIAKLGSGGMSTVYRARKESLGKIVALKILSPMLARNQDYIARFFREARAAAQLNHPNIVAGYDVGECNGYYYFAMEYVPGETLKQILKNEGKLAAERALNITAQVAEALRHAREKGLMHRDVKPGNIIITSAGLVKLADLGLAKAFHTDSSVTQEGRTIGTPDYASPEQARGELDVDIRTDIYSLGATLFHMITGRVPFTGSTPAAIFARHITEELPPLHVLRQEMPEPLARLIRKMMAKDRNRRQADPAELIGDIQQTIRELQAPQPPARTQRVRQPQTASKSKAPLIAGTLIALAALAGGAFLLTRNGDTRQIQRPPSDNGDTAVAPPEETPEQKAEKEAAAAYDSIKKAIAGHPDAHDRILAVCNAFLDKFGDTDTAGLVRELRSQTLQHRQAEAQQAIADTSAATGQLLAEHRYGDAFARWQQLRPDADRLDIGGQVDAEIDALNRRAENEFDQICAQAAERAKQGEFDAAIAMLDAAAARYGIEEVAQQARAASAQLEEQRKTAEVAGAAARRQVEQIKKETYGTVDTLVGELRFGEAEGNYRRLEESADPALLEALQPFLSQRREDIQALAALKQNIIENINAQPAIERTIQLRTGRPVKATKCSASGNSLTITFTHGSNEAETSVAWEKIAPQTLSELAAAAAPDDLLVQSLLAYYTGQYPLARRLLDDARQQEDAAERAARLLELYDEAAAVRLSANLHLALERAAQALEAGRLDDCLAILNEAAAGIAEAPGMRGQFKARIDQLKSQATEKLARRKIDMALQAAEQQDWPAVVKLLAEIDKEFSKVKVVQVDRRPEIENLRLRSERLLADPMMIEAIKAFIRLDDQRAVGLFTRISREREGSLAADARQFLEAFRITVNLPDDCATAIKNVRRDPDKWFRIMIYRSIRRKCPGSREEADARLRMGEIFLLPPPGGIARPAWARELFKDYVRDFRKYDNWSASGYTKLGEAESACENWPEAEKIFDTVVQKYPGEQPYCMHVMRLKAEHYAPDDPNKALAVLEKALQDYRAGGGRAWGEGCISLGRLYRDSLGKKDEAIEAFVTAFERFLGTDDYMSGRGALYSADLLVERNRKPEAVRVLARFASGCADKEGSYCVAAREKLRQLQGN